MTFQRVSCQSLDKVDCLSFPEVIILERDLTRNDSYHDQLTAIFYFSVTCNGSDDDVYYAEAITDFIESIIEESLLDLQIEEERIQREIMFLSGANLQQEYQPDGDAGTH